MSNSMEMSASITIKIPRLKVRKFLVTQPVHLKWFFNLLESKLHLEAGITSGLLNILLFMFLSFATPCWVAALGFALGSCFAIKVHFHRIFHIFTNNNDNFLSMLTIPNNKDNFLGQFPINKDYFRTIGK